MPNILHGLQMQYNFHEWLNTPIMRVVDYLRLQGVHS